jgi:hypothetical protein
MSVIPIDVQIAGGNAAGESPKLWQKIAKALDQLVINRSRCVVPAVALWRARHEQDRCRQLMHQRKVP